MALHTSERFDLLSVGEVLVDLVAHDAPDIAIATSFIPAPGGAPANVAVAAARLGARAAFVGAVGDDPFGHLLSRVLQENEVDLSALKIVSERTTVAFVARNRGGIPDFVFYRGADTTLTPEDVPLDLITRSTFVYLGSMALMSQRSADTAMYVVEAARETGTLIAVDPNLRPSSWPSTQVMLDAVMPLIEAAHVLKVNDQEARLLTGTEDLNAAIRRLARDALLVVTEGASGCYWRWGKEKGQVAAPRVKVSDTTGAGDAFTGALLARLAEGRPSPETLRAMSADAIAKTLRFACGAGAWSCTAPGAMPSLPTRDQVDSLLLEDKQKRR